MTHTMAEPEWDDQTRQTVLALAQVSLCPLCSRPTEICQAIERQDDWRVDPPVRCHATTAVLQAQSRITEETNPQSRALLWSAYLSAQEVGRG